MAINYNFGSRLTPSRSSQAKGSSSGNIPNILYGRVTDIVVDAFHPLYNTYGKSQALYGVEYVEVTTAADLSDDAEKKFAYCGSTFFKRLPLKSEIVLIINAPSSGNRDFGGTSLNKYWIDIVPIWNHTHHNAYPDVTQEGEGDADLGKYFEEQSAVNNLQMFPGDVIVEGRHGSSLRFGGTKFDSNEITDSSNNMKPFTILRNGQVESQDGIDTVLENIDEDPTSIYLTSDHTINLTQANDKRDALEEEPDKANSFKGNQVLINSGRLFFNAKEEGIFLSAAEQIGFNSKEIGLDADKYIALDSKKIYLGVEGFRENEPVLKGQSSIDWLDDFISQFETIVKGMATAPPAPPAFVAKMVATSNALLPNIPVLKQQLKLLLSKKVYTE